MGLMLPIAAMAIIVAVSNYAVQFPISDWLTWGALTYPVTFLVTDLTNRRYSAAATRRVVYVGFAFAVVLSIWLATPRIALASGTAFLIAQLSDVFIFDRLRNRPWWQAPPADRSRAGAVWPRSSSASTPTASWRAGSARRTWRRWWRTARGAGRLCSRRRTAWRARHRRPSCTRCCRAALPRRSRNPLVMPPHGWRRMAAPSRQSVC